MNGYIVSYDLNTPGQDYKNLHAEFTEYRVCEDYLKELDSTYVIISELSAKEIFDILLEHIDSSDNILIIEVKQHWAAWMSKSALKWLKEKIP